MTLGIFSRESSRRLLRPARSTALMYWNESVFSVLAGALILGSYSAMRIVCLRFLIELASLSPPVYHAGMHGYGFLEDFCKKALAVGMSH